MSNIFYNHEENRPRAVWRLILQGLLFAFLLLGLQIVSGILVAALLPGGLLQGDPLEAQDVLLNHPLLRIAVAISQVVAIFVSLWLAARWLDKRRLRDYGFHTDAAWWRDLAFGLVLGALLMAVIFGVELAAGWIQVTGYTQAGASGYGFGVGILTALILFLSVGIYEEALSRGYHLRNLAEGFHGPQFNPRTALLIAYVLSSAAFGLFHALNPNSSAISTFNLMLAGLFLGLGFVLTGELAIPIGLHITWNFFQGNVFGFPVSGMQFGATFISIEQGGPDLVTGGAFGPEAGLIGLAAMLLGSLLTYLWVRFTRREARLREELAVYRGRPGEEVNG